MLDVRRLRLLRELALRGTIAAVAQALAFSPSAVSQQLSVLEREAGVQLLERTGRNVALTPAARNLVRHAEAVLEHLEMAAADLAAARHGPVGPVRIGAFPTATRTIVPDALAALTRDHPGLEPMVREIDPAEVADALRCGDLDLALVHTYDFVPSTPEPGLVTAPLFTEPMYLASMRPVEAAGDLPLLARYGDAPWITATPGTLCHAMTLGACRAAGFAPQVRHHIDEFATVLALVALGQGVAIVPHLGALDPPRDVALTRLPVRRHTLVAHRRGAAHHPAIAAAVRALRDAAPSLPG